MLFVIAHNIRSLHNVGSIFRTADGAGVTKVYLTGYTGTPPRKEISKVALGAEETVPWEYVRRPIEIIRKLKRAGVTIVALEKTDQSIDYRRFHPCSSSVALIIGNEVRGISTPLLRYADTVMHIPMRGSKESLNVSVAFGIAVYSYIRIAL